jgi:hypothetical protein
MKVILHQEVCLSLWNILFSYSTKNRRIKHFTMININPYRWELNDIWLKLFHKIWIDWLVKHKSHVFVAKNEFINVQYILHMQWKIGKQSYSSLHSNKIIIVLRVWIYVKYLIQNLYFSAAHISMWEKYKILTHILGKV